MNIDVNVKENTNEEMKLNGVSSVVEKEMIDKVLKWANEREIFQKGNINAQMMKTYEELTELQLGIVKDDIELIKDSIGDVLVTLIIGTKMDKSFNYYLTSTDKEAVELMKTYTKVNKSRLLYHITSTMDLLNRYIYEHRKGQITLLTTLWLIADVYNLTLKECIEKAYSEIKNRQGEMVDGTFVKKVV